MAQQNGEDRVFLGSGVWRAEIAGVPAARKIGSKYRIAASVDSVCVPSRGMRPVGCTKSCGTSMTQSAQAGERVTKGPPFWTERWDGMQRHIPFVEGVLLRATRVAFPLMTGAIVPAAREFSYLRRRRPRAKKCPFPGRGKCRNLPSRRSWRRCGFPGVGVLGCGYGRR